MIITTKRFSGWRWRMLAAVGLLAHASLVAAQPSAAAGYPNKPIRVIVPVPSGAAADIAVRRLADSMGATLGQPLVIDNRPGAGGGLGMGLAAKAAPDGYTLVVGTQNILAFNPALYKTVPYDTVKDFAPISRFISVPNVLAVSSSLGVTTMSDLVALAKKRAAEKRPINYASGGNGTSSHLSGAQWRNKINVDINHVPYKGGPASVVDLIAGRVELTFANIQLVLPQVNAGTLKALAVTSAKRSSQLPDVPTVAELGMPELEMASWIGLLAPAGTDPAIIEKVQAALLKAAHLPETKAAYEKDGNVVETDATTKSFQQLIAKDVEKWTAIIRSSGITLD